MSSLPLWPDSTDALDVNVTMLLEPSVGEPVRAKILHQECIRFEPGRDSRAPRRWPHATERLSRIRPSRPVRWDPGEVVLDREIVRQGAMTGRAHLHATSWIEDDREDFDIVFEHLPAATRAIRRSYVMQGPDERAIAHITETLSASVTATPLQDRGNRERARSRPLEDYRELKH